MGPCTLGSSGPVFLTLRVCRWWWQEIYRSQQFLYTHHTGDNFGGATDVQVRYISMWNCTWRSLKWVNCAFEVGLTWNWQGQHGCWHGWNLKPHSIFFRSYSVTWQVSTSFAVLWRRDVLCPHLVLCKSGHMKRSSVFRNNDSIRLCCYSFEWLVWTWQLL